MAGGVEADAQISVELIPVQLDPAVLESKANSRDNQPKEEQAEHGEPGIQKHGTPVTP